MISWYLFVRAGQTHTKEIASRDRALSYAKEIACGEPVEVWVADSVVTPSVTHKVSEFWKFKKETENVNDVK